MRSGRRLKIAVDLSHCRLSNAGDPLMTLPAGTSCETPDCAVMITPSPSLQCPATPDCPARIAFFPISDEPARPTCAQSRLLAPTFDPCPTCTRLSIFTPGPTLVSPTLARSTVELAWIS